jgi:hypothetical protein
VFSLTLRVPPSVYGFRRLAEYLILPFTVISKLGCKALIIPVATAVCIEGAGTSKK